LRRLVGSSVSVSATRIRTMAEHTQTVEERLEEIGTQLAWVRDYL
jgi:hypothetical protein